MGGADAGGVIGAVVEVTDVEGTVVAGVACEGPAALTMTSATTAVTTLVSAHVHSDASRARSLITYV